MHPDPKTHEVRRMAACAESAATEEEYALWFPEPQRSRGILGLPYLARPLIPITLGCTPMGGSSEVYPHKPSMQCTRAHDRSETVEKGTSDE